VNDKQTALTELPLGEIARLREIEVTARDLWERRSGHRMGAPDWRAPQECFYALRAALEGRAEDV
jgi:hypothetical protein